MTDINNTPEMNEEEYTDVVVMTDDEGNEYLYDIAARIEKNDNEYVVLVPQDEEIDDETEEFVAEEDEAITDAVFEEFKQLFEDEYNFTDGDEDDDALFTDAE